MPHLYPPLAPTLSGDTVTISRFLSQPALVSRRLRTIAEQRFIADFLLTGRQESSGGAFLVETSESLYPSGVPEEVAPGAEYPRVGPTTGVATLARIAKLGFDEPVTDEAIGRQGIDPVNRALTKLVNQLVLTVDSLCLSVIGTAVTQTQAVTNGAWSATTATPFRDAMLAKAQILALNQGYDPNVLVVTDALYAYLVSNAGVISGFSREQADSITATGRLPRIADLNVVSTPNLPAGVTAMVIDTAVFGSIGYERIPSPEYTGDPATGPETWTRRDPRANDAWLVRARRPVVPLVQEPLAAIKITGA